MSDEDRTLTLIRQLSSLAETPADLPAYLQRIATLAAECTGADGSSLMLLDRDDSTLVMSATHGLAEDAIRRITFQPGEGIAGRVLETGRLERYDDVVGEPQFEPYAWQDGQIRSLLVVPVRSASRSLGVLSVHAAATGVFGDPEQAWLGLIARQVATDLENAWLRERSCYDPLTRVYNRAHCLGRLQEEVKRARRHGGELSLMSIDIDRFRTVNEIHGTFVGDMVLREFARRVADEVRGEDLFARWTSEEFFLLLPHTAGDAALRIAERVRMQVYQRAFRSRRGAIPLTVSVGVGWLDDDHDSVEAVIDRCREALGRAKRAGGNRIEPPLPAADDDEPS